MMFGAFSGRRRLTGAATAAIMLQDDGTLQKKCGAAKIAVSRVGTNCGQCGKAKSDELAIICGVAYDMM